MNVPPVHTRKSTHFYGKDKHDSEGTEGAESNYARCRWCGAINKIHGRNARSRGDGWGGNIALADSGATATTLYYELPSGGGCWFCHSSNGW